MLANARLCGVMLELPEPRGHRLPEGRHGLERGAQRASVRRSSRRSSTATAAGKVKTVIGEVVPFDELPRAIDAMGNRGTIGRIVITV